jgi:competence ComEA-like helix-hairpin-helix protein
VNGLKTFFLGFLVGALFAGLLAYFYLKPNFAEVNSGVQIDKFAQATSKAGDYLGKINLNLADEAQLEKIPGIGEVKARSIIEFRDKYGNFVEVDDLLYVSGISSSLLNTIRQYLYIER